MQKSVLNIENINSDPKTNEFEKLYLQVRKKEQRIYTDEEVSRLPSISTGHKHFKDWEIRKRSLNKFIKFLKQKNKTLRILEIGCGNGWLSAALAKADVLWNVTGSDINNSELEQAKRVFASLTNLDFIYADINSSEFPNESFDIILFASSIQYFSSFKKTIEQVLKLLLADGEIHIIDTIFYKNYEIAAARRRSIDYFSSLGFPGAAANYFHHSIEEIRNFNSEILQKPSSAMGRLLGQKNPFYWLRIRNKS